MSAEKPTILRVTQHAAMAPVTRVAVAQSPRLNAWEFIFRVVIIFVLLASLALAWWTFTKFFIPVQKQSRELTSQFARLSTEVDQLERKWSKADTEQIRGGYQEVYGQLFADQPALEAWLVDLEAQAGPLGLDVKIDFGQTAPPGTNEQKLAVVPARVALEVRPVPGGTDSPYLRLLRLTRQLAAEGKRADLAEMTVVGGPASIARATLVFNLWAGEEGKP
jgi:hypothetical protein